MKHNWFEIFVEYCKSSKQPVDQQYTLIWNTEYPSMIRRSLAMKLKAELDKLPVEDKTDDLKALIMGLQEQLKPVSKFFAEPTPEPKKRISKKEKERLDFEAYEKRLQAKALAYIKNGG